MKITIDIPRTVERKTLRPGDLFLFNGDVFMATDGDGGISHCSSVKLANGMEYLTTNSARVERLEGELKVRRA